MSTDLLKHLAVSGEAHFGSVAINSLGFEDWLIPDICPRQDDITICAHAPSVVNITTAHAISVRGFINASGSIDPRNPIDFYANHNLLGSLHSPAGFTTTATLPPGTHRLEAYCTVPAHGRHSVWHVAEANADTAIDTAVVTLATYPESEIREKLRLLQLSCFHHSVWLDVAGVNEPFQDWYHSKICRMRQHIGMLSDNIKYVLFVDAHDTVVAASLDRIRDGFLRCGRGVVVSAESCCFPCRDTQWVDGFPMKPDSRRFPCAGIWMGERRSLMSAFETLERVHDKLRTGSGPDAETSPFWIHRGYHNDDQFLWQCLYKYQLADVGVDSDCEFAFNVACAGAEINNRQFDFRTRTVKSTGNRPGVFHFSSLKYACMEQWYSLLTPSEDQG